MAIGAFHVQSIQWVAAGALICLAFSGYLVHSRRDLTKEKESSLEHPGSESAVQVKVVDEKRSESEVDAGASSQPLGQTDIILGSEANYLAEASGGPESSNEPAFVEEERNRSALTLPSIEVEVGSRCDSRISGHTCVAVMICGLWRDISVKQLNLIKGEPHKKEISEKHIQALHEHFLEPLAADMVDIDLFVCHEKWTGASFLDTRPKMSSIAKNRELISYYSEGVAEPPANQTQNGALVQFGRIQVCYDRFVKHELSRYSFVVRTRPDLLWYAPPSVQSWDRDALSARFREYSGPEIVTDEHKSSLYGSPQTCEATCCGTDSTCTRDCDTPERSSCQLVDDQFYIVPPKFANVVFAFTPSLCGKPNCPERALTRYLMENKVPFKVLGFRACLVRPDGSMAKPRCGDNWEFEAHPPPFHHIMSRWNAPVNVTITKPTHVDEQEDGGSGSPDRSTLVSSPEHSDRLQPDGNGPKSQEFALAFTVSLQHQKLVAWIVIILGLGIIIMTACHLYYTASIATQIGAVAALLYLVVAVTIDVLVQSESREEKNKSPFVFDPACVMLLVELGKLAVSVLLFTGFKSQSSKPWQSMNDAVRAFTVRDVGLLACPAIVFFANNMLMFFANGCNNLSSFGAFRETLILWTALLWTMTFQVSLGTKRISALMALIVGLVLNQVMPLMQASFNPAAISLVCLMSFANAAGSVCFEWVVKQQATLDLDLQNIVLYFWGTLFSFCYLAMLDGGKLVNIRSFFVGFTLIVAMIVCCQMFAGLFISRMLKYADSVTRSVVASLRGPVLVFLAPVLGIHSIFDGLTITSNIIVASSALYFLLQGRPGSPNEQAS